jgi:pyruvate dehydrogenase E1 component alpha subunit
MLGRKGSYSGGKGGPIHLSCLDKNIIGIVGLVPAWLPIMTGTALSAKLRKTGQVAVCPFGDGASNQGYFHEGLNFASVHKLPIVFVCENNLYAISVSVKQSTSVENIADRAVGYNMPGVVVDGNDVIAVYEAVLQAVNRARQGDGPTLIECKTYRWGGHFAMDPGTKYRPKEEIESWMKKCPLKRFRKKLLEDNITTESEIKQIESDVENQLEEAITYANECPYPEPQELLTGVFADQDKKDERRRQ